jgi:ABC-type dipeptide/oligopeptide/nickel transport system permease component
VLQAGAFVVAGLVVLSSLLSDIAYALLNPKIRYA